MVIFTIFLSVGETSTLSQGLSPVIRATRFTLYEEEELDHYHAILFT